MSLKNYIIAPFDSGLQNNVEPWLLPENAFNELINAYVWRGRVRKRFGYSYIGLTELESRLRVNIGTTDAITGNFSTTVPGAVFAVGQMFSIGTTIFSVNTTGTPATLLTTGTATGTYNTTTGALTITGNSENPSTAVYFYPSTPVMGLRTRETSSVNAEQIIAFDTQFSYQRSGGAWERITSGGAASVWTGSNKDFFWTTNYRGASLYESYLYVVNNTSTDTIRYFSSSLSAIPNTWSSLNPDLVSGGSRKLTNARIIIGFKDRLLVLNTIEEEGVNSRLYFNRARWSQNGSPLSTDAWYDDTPGKGGYIDATTDEAIISCEFLKDRLIVYFERSTWELVYTGDASLPFRWQQINSELGCESTFSMIGFDKVCTGVGNVGIHSCNGVNVERIDEKIPDEVFKIHNANDGVERVYGIRDYYRELVYWTFPDFVDSPTFPNRILVWNYQNNTWAFMEESFTCFGYFQKDSTLTWANVGSKFGTWAEWNQPWNSGQAQSQFPDIIAGNQQGFVFTVETDKSFNNQSLYITDMTSPKTLSIINHNFQENEYILIEECEGITSLNGIVVQVQSVTTNTIVIDTEFTGTYTGGGKVTRISNIDITSKQWNPGSPIGIQFNFPYMDLLLNRTVDGEATLDTYIDFNESDPLTVTTDPGVSLGSTVLYTKAEASLGSDGSQKRIWHRFFLEAIAQTLQIKIFFSDEQMRDLDIVRSDFQLNGIILYAAPKGRIIG